MASELELRLFMDYVRRRMSFEFDDETMGELAVTIVSTLLERGEAIPDDKLASLINANGTDIRRLLHVMHVAGLVGLARETSDQYRYDYKWYMDREFVRRFLEQHVDKVTSKVARLLNRISSTTLYMCPKCFRRYTMDEAYSYNFTCPRDDTPLSQPDPSKEIAALSTVLRDLRGER